MRRNLPKTFSFLKFWIILLNFSLKIISQTANKYYKIKSDSKRKAQPNELAILRPFLAIFLANTLIFLIKLRFLVLIVVLMCLTYLNPNLIKNYDIKHNFCHFCFFQFCKKKNWKITTHKWPFYDHFWPFFCQFSQNWGSEGHFKVHSGSKS